ncbi:MAG: LCP family protein [Lachnospiraceae bacterium]|nr:LCP family protein [Lachnospiraceae bacterium]
MTKTNKKKKTKAWLVILIVILALLLLIAVAAWAVISHYLNKIEKIPSETFLPPDALTDETDAFDPENTDLPVLDTVDWDWEDTTAPETDPVGTKAPETEAPGTEPVETDPPETKAPETDPPETREPYVPETQPSDPGRETSAPETQKPETGAPETKAPETVPPKPIESLPDETNVPGRTRVSESELINILLVGQDTRIPGQRMNTDTMILCSINVKSREITLTSFMRDLYVQMPAGYQDNRLNVAYIYGGFPFLYQVLEKNFGVHCDGGFEIDFSGFKDLIDVLGGVDVNINSSEVTALPGVKVGMNHLDGTKALYYVRLREIGTDFQRTQRQRILLTSVFESVKGADTATLYELLNTALPLMRTDMSNAKITGYALKLLPILSEFKVYTFRLPVEGAYYGAYVRGMSVLVPNLSKNRQALKDFISVW